MLNTASFECEIHSVKNDKMEHGIHKLMRSTVASVVADNEKCL
jgi:hypothetical protein